MESARGPRSVALEGELASHLTRWLLLFPERYPQGFCDLVAGRDRWVLRVMAYAAFLTREYRPFRLAPPLASPIST